MKPQRMKSSILSLLVILVLATGCKKDKDEEPGGVPKGDSYQPLTQGSFWKYKQTGLFAGEYTLTATGTKKTVDGIEYVLMESSGSGQSSSAYYGVKDNNYYLRVVGTSPGGLPFDLTQLYLNDKEAAGYTWPFAAGHGNDFAAFAPGKIIERDLTMTVQGKSYTNVIHTQVKLSYEIPEFGTMGGMIYDYYMAKGVGVIRSEATVDSEFAPPGSAVAELVQFNIK